MRKGLIFAIPAVLVMLASGCARDRILAPAREPSSTDASYSPQFVLHSLDDPALPAPGREAEAATTQDGALLDRFQMTRRPGTGGDTPSAIVFWNRLTTELGLNLAGVEQVLHLEDELLRMRRRLERLESEMRDALNEVHRQYRRDLVLYRPSEPPVPTTRKR